MEKRRIFLRTANKWVGRRSVLDYLGTLVHVLNVHRQFPSGSRAEQSHHASSRLFFANTTIHVSDWKYGPYPNNSSENIEDCFAIRHNFQSVFWLLYGKFLVWEFMLSYWYDCHLYQNYVLRIRGHDSCSFRPVQEISVRNRQKEANCGFRVVR